MMTSAEVSALTDGYLPHSCTLIAPGAEIGHDPYEEGLDAPDVETTGVACWVSQSKAEGEAIAPGSAVVVHTWRVLVGSGVAATEATCVANVRDEGGALILAGPVPVTEILRRRGHKTLICQQASNGTVAP